MAKISINSIEIPLEIKRLPTETVPVVEAIGRVAAEDIAALSDCPPHSEALRDGYVLAPFQEEIFPPDIAVINGSQGQGARDLQYPVVGEIAAGSPNIGSLSPGSACRIFTGGLIPEGGVRVVPQEECEEVAGGKVRVTATTLASDRLFINVAGSEVGCGATVVSKGIRLEIDHLTLLTSVGVHQVPVVTRPRVACFCTGSELVAVGREVEAGRKLSLNSLLFAHLIPRYGGVMVEQGIIVDTQQAIAGMFDSLGKDHCDLVVTTGGMGPGKYDLVKKAFSDAGGTIILDCLPMYPGRSIVLGILGSTVFIALPGPPNAVRTLANELVGPVMLMMQGAQHFQPKALQARLLHDFRVKKADLLQVKSGVLMMEQGRCMVRLAGRLDPVSCFILFTAGRREFVRGDVVQVHLAATNTGCVFSDTL